MTDKPVTTDEHSYAHLSVCVMKLYLRGVIILGGNRVRKIEAGFGSLLGHLADSPKDKSIVDRKPSNL